MKAILRFTAAILLTAAMSIAGATSAQAASPKWLSISSGGFHTCAIATNHSLWCWGNNEAGELGNDASVAYQRPIRVGTSTKWVSVSAGGTQTCALHESGSIYCWGWNKFGQVGTGTSDDSVYRPMKVGTSTKWVSVVTGEIHTCALHRSGSIYCWGDNSEGELGLGDTNERDTPKKVGTSTSWKSVSAGGGSDHTCALHSSGAIYCWGDNSDGEVGNGTISEAVTTPKKAGTSTSWKSVNVGAGHTCATHSGGTLYCWGDNPDGGLGIGTADDAHSPAKVGTSTSWLTVSPGAQHTCALHSGATIYCFGLGNYGQLGDGTASDRLTPKKVTGTVKWASVSAGEYHTCGLDISGYAYCWGYNEAGQLGNGTTENGAAPIKVTETGTVLK